MHRGSSPGQTGPMPSSPANKGRAGHSPWRTPRAARPAAALAGSRAQGTPKRRSAPQARRPPTTAGGSGDRTVRSRPDRAMGQRRRPTCPSRGEIRTPVPVRPRRCRRPVMRRAARRGFPCRAGRQPGLPAHPARPWPPPPSPCPAPPCRNPWRSAAAARSGHRVGPPQAWSATPLPPRRLPRRRQPPQGRPALRSGRWAAEGREARSRRPGETRRQRAPGHCGSARCAPMP